MSHGRKVVKTIDRVKLVKLYNYGLGTKALAERFGTNRDRIREELAAAGIVVVKGRTEEAGVIGKAG